MYEVTKIGLFNISGQIKVAGILHTCGKNMSKQYDLHHWDNSHIKTQLIVAICELKNKVYLISDGGKLVATIQTKIKDGILHVEKLATLPTEEHKGIGTYCLQWAEEQARRKGCNKICVEVYEANQYAKNYYLHRNYQISGEKRTNKYLEVKMEKSL